MGPASTIWESIGPHHVAVALYAASVHDNLVRIEERDRLLKTPEVVGVGFDCGCVAIHSAQASADRAHLGPTYVAAPGKMPNEVAGPRLLAVEQCPLADTGPEKGI